MENRESDLPLVSAVMHFMALAGQTTDRFNARQACLYTGLQIEELAEKIETIMGGTITPAQFHHLNGLLSTLKQFATEFKNGDHTGSIMRANHAELIDADFDLAWVSVAALASTSVAPERAIAHGTFTNLDKFRGGQCIRDANGKVQKPADWRAPDFAPYIDTTVLA